MRAIRSFSGDPSIWLHKQHGGMLIIVSPSRGHGPSVFAGSKKVYHRTPHGTWRVARETVHADSAGIAFQLPEKRVRGVLFYCVRCMRRILRQHETRGVVNRRPELPAGNTRVDVFVMPLDAAFAQLSFGDCTVHVHFYLTDDAPEIRIVAVLGCEVLARRCDT